MDAVGPLGQGLCSIHDSVASCKCSTLWGCGGFQASVWLLCSFGICGFIGEGCLGPTVECHGGVEGKSDNFSTVPCSYILWFKVQKKHKLVCSKEVKLGMTPAPKVP